MFATVCRVLLFFLGYNLLLQRTFLHEVIRCVVIIVIVVVVVTFIRRVVLLFECESFHFLDLPFQLSEALQHLSYASVRLLRVNPGRRCTCLLQLF